LTGLGANSWATFYYPHLLTEECQLKKEEFDGVICNGADYNMRRVAFYKAFPTSFRLEKLKVAQWTKEFEAAVKADPDDFWNFKQDVNHKNFSRIDMRPKKNPVESWPFVVGTGKRYRLHWGEGQDFEKISFELSPLWAPTDQNVDIVTNFTDVRMAVNFTDNHGDFILNRTLLRAPEKMVTGMNVIYNQTEVREIHWVINGKHDRTQTRWDLEGFRCVQNDILLWKCKDEEIDEGCKMSDIPKPWSSKDTWPSGELPKEGEIVEVPPCTWIEYDIEDSPIFEKVEINGRLSFKDDIENPVNRTLRSFIVYVRAGELLIGSED
jgi:hypothetical protein